MSKIVALNTRYGSLRKGFIKANVGRCHSDENQLRIFESLQNPDNLRENNLFIKALTYDGKENELAESFYWKAITCDDHQAEAYCNLGILSSDNGEQVQAIHFFIQALKENPAFFEAHYNLANIYAQTENFPLARQHYEIAISLSPEITDTYYNLAILFVQIHDYSNAYIMLDRYKRKSNNSTMKSLDQLLENIQYFLKQG